MTRKPLKIAAYTLYLIAFVEIGLQGFYYYNSGNFLFRRHAVPIYRRDPHMGYGVKANLDFHHVTNEFDYYIYTNSEGLRTSTTREEYPAKTDDSRFRVLLLGPSFAFGWGVNHQDTFAHQLQNSLTVRQFAPGQEIEVINAGVPAMQAANQLNWFDRYGYKYSPDLVIQFVYGGMWVTDVMNHSSEVDSEGYLISANRPPSERLRSFLKNFAIVHYGWVVSTSLTPNSDSRVEGAGRPLEEQPHFNPEDEGTRGAMSFYNHLSNSVSANKSKLLVVHFPLSYVVHRQDMIRWRHLGVGDVDTQIVVNDRFCGYLNQVAIPCLNITRDLIDGAAVSDSRLYYWLDIHWTAKGNHIAAEAVARHLTKDQD